MNRVWDNIGFAMSFAGFGYIVLWLTGSLDDLMLSPALHVVGAAAAVFACVNLLLRAVGRRRHAGIGSAAPPASPARPPAGILRSQRRKPARPLPQVKPRNHFGLRGRPH
jgi:hypothetical protein